MPDKYGRPLRAGDRVLFSAAQYGGIQEGVLKYDADEKAKYHIFVQRNDTSGTPQETLKHYNKVAGNDPYMINVAHFVRDQLDNGTLDLID